MLHASTNVKRQLYLSLIRSHLTYCSQLWRPRLVKDIENLERIQRRATKYIVGNNQMDYKSRLRLLSVHLLPLMYWLELQDVMFLVKCLRQPTARDMHIMLFEVPIMLCSNSPNIKPIMLIALYPLCSQVTML